MNLLKKRSKKIFYFSNVCLSLLCTSCFTMNYIKDYKVLKQPTQLLTIASNDSEVVSHIGVEQTKPKVVAISNNGNKKTTNVVKTKSVAATKKYTPAKYNEVTGNAIVDYAKKYLGLRYVSNGYSLSTGTDCSGFTKLIYKEFGVNLSRAVKSQVGNGSYVSKSDLQKGDLVFYGYGDGKVHHVAIYIGAGQVIHESNHRDGVKISSLNMMQYITARRVINSTADKIAVEKTTVDVTKEDNNVLSDVSKPQDEEVIINEEVIDPIVESEPIIEPENKNNENDSQEDVVIKKSAEEKVIEPKVETEVKTDNVIPTEVENNSTEKQKVNDTTE